MWEEAFGERLILTLGGQTGDRNPILLRKLPEIADFPEKHPRCIGGRLLDCDQWLNSRVGMLPCLRKRHAEILIFPK
jgi:hypothetical protein